jgi:hypothetical protein
VSVTPGDAQYGVAEVIVGLPGFAGAVGGDTTTWSVVTHPLPEVKVSV